METNPGMTYINGEFVPADQASLPLMDAGFWLGINIFDTLSAYRGAIFKLDAHVARFFRGLHAIRIDIPFTREEFGRADRRDGPPQRSARFLHPDDRHPRHARVAADHRVAADRDHQRHPLLRDRRAGRRGPRVCGSGSARSATCRSRASTPKSRRSTGSTRYLARLEALDAGADDAIMLDLDGYVTEGRGANIWHRPRRPPLHPARGAARRDHPRDGLRAGRRTPACRRARNSSLLTTCTMPTKSSTRRPPAASCRSSRSIDARSATAVPAQSRSA